jgi:erythromycin esterase-like protein
MSTTRTGGTAALRDAIRDAAIELRTPDDVGPIVERLRGARIVLLGEATHGTHEFYALRAAITLRLVAEHGFDAVAVEADWPDALRVARHLRGDADVADARDALAGFERFPRWMWRNHEVLQLVTALRTHNQRLAPTARVGFYGIDVYSLRASIDAVLRFLAGVDPELARQARDRYACFDGLADEPQRYGWAARRGLVDSCEDSAVQQLAALCARSARDLPRAAGVQGADELFYAQQNARVVRGAEQYFRALYRGGTAAWNLRDTHMADTVQALARHLHHQRGRPARLVVWAHNSHIGDARATAMGEGGEINLGQLMRQRAAAPGDVFLLGFTTHGGHVAAASDWDQPVLHQRVRPALEGSVEKLLHDAGVQRALVPLSHPALEPALSARWLERAIGVVYRPDTERHSHYFGAHPARQFDAIVHVDRTRAVTPLDAAAEWQAAGAEAETFPSGL